MEYLSKNDIKRMSEKTSILKVTEYYKIELIAEGRGEDRFKALCPFHAENTPSFKVYPDKNSWYTYCCRRGTTPYHLILELETHRGGDDVRDRAVLVLQQLSGEERVGDPLERVDQQLSETRQYKQSIRMQHQLISTFVRDWLHKRCLDQNYSESCILAEKCFRHIDKYLSKEEIDEVCFKKLCSAVRNKLKNPQFSQEKDGG